MIDCSLQNPEDAESDEPSLLLGEDDDGASREAVYRNYEGGILRSPDGECRHMGRVDERLRTSVGAE